MCNIVIIVTKIESVRLTTIIEWLKIESDSSKKKLNKIKILRTHLYLYIESLKKIK